MALSRRTGARFQGSIWPGFVDAMTGLLLVLMFVLTIFMIVQFILTERITGQETELDALAGEVAALAQALGLEEQSNARLEARLGALNASLNTTRDDLTATQGRLSETQDQLAAAEGRVSEQDALIASLRSQNDAQAAALAEVLEYLRTKGKQQNNNNSNDIDMKSCAFLLRVLLCLL